MADPARFQVVEQIPDLAAYGAPAGVTAPAAEPSRRGDIAAANAMVLALKALSQRALTAVTDLFTLLTVASAFWLWHTTPDPSPTQIASLSLYALFILAANWLVRRQGGHK